MTAAFTAASLPSAKASCIDISSNCFMGGFGHAALMISGLFRPTPAVVSVVMQQVTGPT